MIKEDIKAILCVFMLPVNAEAQAAHPEVPGRCGRNSCGAEVPLDPNNFFTSLSTT